MGRSAFASPGTRLLSVSNQKRSRTSAATPAGPWEKVREAARDAGLIGRLLIALTAVAATVVSIQAWSAPFPYREGDYIAHGVIARLAFNREDPEETLRQRADREQRAPFVFRNNTEQLSELSDRLKAHLGQVTTAERPEDLPLETRRAFGFGDGSGMGVADERTLAQFAALKEAVSPSGQQTAESKIADIVSEFDKFLAPLATSGVVDPRDRQRLRIPQNAKLRVLPAEPPPGESLTAATTADPPRNVEPVPLFEVQLSDQLTDAGKLGSSWLYYPHLTEEIQPLIKRWLASQLDPTLEYDEAATTAARTAARESVQSVVRPTSAGDVLVPPRTILTSASLPVLAAEHAAVEAAVTPWERTVRVALTGVLVLVLATLNGYYLVRTDPRVVRSPSRLAVYCASVVVTVAVAKFLSFDPYRAEVVPLVAATLVFCIAYNQVLATVLAVTLCLLITLATTNGDLTHFVVLMATAAAGVLFVGRVRTRDRLVKVGFLVGLVHFAVTYAMRTLVAQEPGELLNSRELLEEAAFSSAWCLFCGFFVGGALPLVEKVFGVVTDISLLELSDPSQELLRDLVARAPGTYQHSLAVANIAERAAEAIGANGLLCRVGAYFHDIGKMLKPGYFIENLEAGRTSPHADLSPTMSTLVIIGHVKDGVDLAQKHNLPQPIIDFIEQHHGTTLVEYFFRAAAKKAESEPDKRTDAEEESFRYPGPKPQTKEAGVMMLVDCCESATRALPETTPTRIKTLVRDLMMKRLLDGQFDECDLTLNELHIIERSIVKSLTAMHHGRIKYPGGGDEAAGPVGGGSGSKGPRPGGHADASKPADAGRADAPRRADVAKSA